MNSSLQGDGWHVDIPPTMLTASQVAALAAGEPAYFQAQPKVIKRFTDQVGVTVNSSGTAATATIDAASPFGKTALKLAIPVGNTRTDVKLTGLNMAAFDDHVCWRVWIEDLTLVNQIAALAGTSGYSRYWQQMHTVGNSEESRFNGEHQVSVGPMRAGTINTFLAGVDTFADMEIRITPAGATNVWVESVCVAPRGVPTMAFTFDDASATWFPYAVSPLASAGIAATFGINSGDVGGGANFINSAQVLALAQAGHQVSPHNVTNTAYQTPYGGTQTAAAYTADFVTCRAALNNWTQAKADWSYHPWVQGKYSQDVITTLRSNGMRVARGVTIGQNFYTPGLGQHVNALRVVYLDGALTTLAQAKAEVDNCFKYGTLAVFMAHELVAGAAGAVQWNRDDFASLVAYCTTKLQGAYGRTLTMTQLARMLYDRKLVAASLQSD